jgi:S1-C subfamily serine protease
MTRYRIATGLVTLAALGCLALPAVAQELPRPYVSRALDAVLLPVDRAVISAFGLGPKDSGALVLATEPGGTADMAGILPGDVISNVRGTRIKDPVQLDSVVWY